MRWDNLFDDLEGQLDRELNAEQIDLRAEEERLRLGRLSLRTRLMNLTGGFVGSAVFRIALTSGDTVIVRPTSFGRDWLAADLFGSEPHPGTDGSGGTCAQCVLPFAAVAGIMLTGEQLERSLNGAETASAARMSDRIGLSFVLRDLCRRRADLEVRTTSGVHTGTIDRVGRDHLDLAVHPSGTLRRSRDVQHYRLVPFDQLLLVRLG